MTPDAHPPLKKAALPFHFVTQVSLTQATGRTARSLQELLRHLREVSGSVIYHHTHRFLKQHQFLSPEPPNDFAYWVGAALQDDKLAEKLASIDTVDCPSLRELRERIIQVIEAHLRSPGNDRTVFPGDEFHFLESVSFVLPTPFSARDLKEFADCIEKISVHSLYHHTFESRLRLEGGTNDFALWLEKSLGETRIAAALRRMDPYTHTLEGLRSRILTLLHNRIREAGHA